MNELEKNKYFKECYKMWLKTSEKKHTEKNFQVFTMLWNARLEVAQEKAIFSFYDLLETDIKMGKDISMENKK